MNQSLTRLVLSSLLLAGSLNAWAADEIEIISPEERQAINIAKMGAGGGRVVSTDHDLTNWDVNLLRGCTLFKIEVSHSTKRISSRKIVSYCDDAEAVAKLRAKANEYARTHR